MFSIPKPNRIIQIIGMLIMAAAVAVVLFSGVPVITQAGVRARLDQFAAHVQTQAARSGKEGAFVYDGIELRGWGFSTYASISNVSLAFAESSVIDTTRWTFSTARMDVRPDPVRPGTLLFVLPEPVNVIRNGQLKGTLRFPDPINYRYSDQLEDHVRTVKHMLYLPAQLVWSPGHSVDQPAPPQVTIEYDIHPQAQFILRPDKQEREAAYAFGHVRAMSDDGGETTIGSLVSSFSEKPGADGRVQGTYMLQVSDLVMQSAAQATRPYSLGFDVNYHGARPQDTTEVTLNQLFLAGQDFRVKASGTFHLSVEDPLPFGAIQIDIDHVPQLLACELLPVPARLSLALALQKITGKPLAELASVSLPMKRETKGIAYVGNITFDALAAMLLAEMMKPPPSPAAGVPLQEKQ